MSNCKSRAIKEREQLLPVDAMAVAEVRLEPPPPSAALQLRGMNPATPPRPPIGRCRFESLVKCQHQILKSDFMVSPHGLKESNLEKNHKWWQLLGEQRILISKKCYLHFSKIFWRLLQNLLNLTYFKIKSQNILNEIWTNCILCLVNHIVFLPLKLWTHKLL